MTAIASVPDDAAIAAQDLVIVNPPEHIYLVTSIPVIKPVQGRPFPRRLRALANGKSAMRAIRIDEKTLDLELASGLFPDPFSHYFRGAREPLAAGQRVELTGFSAEVLELGADGEPIAVRYRFDRPLEDASLRWVSWQVTSTRPGPLLRSAPPALCRRPAIHSSERLSSGRAQASCAHSSIRVIKRLRRSGRALQSPDSSAPRAEARMEDVIAKLTRELGPDAVVTGDEVRTRSTGWLRPGPNLAKALVRPRSTEEVSKVLRICWEAHQPVVPQGGLTGLVGGATPSEREICLSLERMTRIESIDPATRTMVVEAGAPLQAIQQAADEHDLLFPLDLGARGACTIGGNVATNAGGNRVIRYGMTRDMVLGLEAVLADGTVLSSLNKMIKNNAGYDLKQLFVGSEGTLGVVTRVVLRLRQKPKSHNAALVAVGDFDKRRRAPRRGRTRGSAARCRRSR